MQAVVDQAVVDQAVIDQAVATQAMAQVGGASRPALVISAQAKDFWSIQFSPCLMN